MFSKMLSLPSMSFPHVLSGQPAGGPPERLGRAGLAGNPDSAFWTPDKDIRE